MEAFEETHKLVRFIQFKEQVLESHRALLMNLNAEGKFQEFAKHPLMNKVPNTVGASFFKMARRIIAG